MTKRQSASIESEQPHRMRHVNERQTVRRIVYAFTPYKFRVFLVFTAVILTTLLGLINPLMIKYIIDDALVKHSVYLLLLFVGIMFVAPIIAGFIGVWQAYLNTMVGQRVMRDFRRKLYDHMHRMSLSFFTSTHAGEIHSRLTNDIGGVQGAITSTVSSTIANLSSVIGTVIAMLFISPILTLVSLGLMPLFIWVTYRVGNIRRSASEKTQQSLATLTTLMQETLTISGVLLAKTFGRHQLALAQFDQENENLAHLQTHQQMVGRWFLMFINIFFSITPAFVYLIAGLLFLYQPHSAGITLGSIVAFTVLQSRLFFPIGQLLSAQVELQGALTLFDRVFEYLDLPIEIEDTPQAKYIKSSRVRGEIRFTNVCFSYKQKGEDALDEQVVQEQEVNLLIEDALELPEDILEPSTELDLTLKHVSFTVKPGQLAALVGPSGAGKTTISYLIPRLYDVDSGEVTIDGINVKEIALDSLSQAIGVVTQETYLFHATVRENLLYARPTASRREMIAAAKAAAIHERIIELENGYETIIGERGYKLSGGEKQRLAIARVILKNPRILLLDEATSSLDVNSERAIQKALEPLLTTRTTIAIAHRLSTILAADLILVLDHGEIVERGSHEELLQYGGLYATLYNQQFAHVHTTTTTGEDIPGKDKHLSHDKLRSILMFRSFFKR